MTLHTLSSGSQGNCLLLSDGDTHILVDAGISTRRIKASLAQLELSMDELDGILITHEHTDHIPAWRPSSSTTPSPVRKPRHRPAAGVPAGRGGAAAAAPGAGVPI